jgi:mannosyltransferase
LPQRLFPWAAAALAVAGLVNLAPYYRYETKPRWDLAAAYLSAHVAPEDAIVAGNAAAKFVLGAYAERYRLARAVLNDGDISQLKPGFLGGGRVWLVIGRTGQAAGPPEQSYLDKWSALGAPAAELRFGRSVIAWRFDPPR